MLVVYRQRRYQSERESSYAEQHYRGPTEGGE